MNDIAPRAPDTDGGPEPPPAKSRTGKRRRWGGRLLGLGVLLVLGGSLAFGASRHFSQQREAVATAEQRRNSVPSVRVATVRTSDGNAIVTLPATTLAFAQANIFARATGYIDKRNVDIGDRVKTDQLLVQITAPELDHQIA